MKADILIIGGGPAALTAALYSLRGGKTVTVLEKEAFGGQIADSPRVENFPSIKTISGLDFSNNLYEQVSALGADLEMDEALTIEKEPDGFKVKGNYGEYEGSSVILATGVKHRHLGIPGEEKLFGHGVSYCAVCDGPFYAGKDVMVIGDANSALQYAILLASECRHVDLVTLFDRFFADEMLIKGVLSLPNVTVTHNQSSVSFNGGENLESVTFQDTKTKEVKEMKTSACFVAIGQIPDNERFKDLVDLEKGFILTDEDMKTKTPGVFAAGDCRKKKWRQLATACNDGAIASLSAQNYLLSLKK
jgi:thioredoxin reductase (NADPH)